MESLRRGLALAILLVLAACAGGTTPAAQPIRLGAAASLRGVLPELITAYRGGRPGGAELIPTYGASGDLKRQVEGGAPLDAVLFASAKPVDDLIAERHVDAATERVVASNALVLIGPRGSPPITFATLDELPPTERIAIGDPGAVPAGQYARDALQRLGKWAAVQDRLVLGGDVGAVLSYARRGEVAAAIVYATEARAIPDVVILDVARGDWAPRPKVVVAALSTSTQPAQTRAFLAWLAAPPAQAIFARHGFGPP